jgi:probable addiction module antidote protein
MMKTKVFDAADHLDNPEVIAAYLSEALESGDPRLVRLALGAVARSVGMSKVANEAGLSRPSLYRALGTRGNPGLDTVIRALRAIGVRLEARPYPAKPPRRAARRSHARAAPAHIAR